MDGFLVGRMCTAAVASVALLLSSGALAEVSTDITRRAVEIAIDAERRGEDVWSRSPPGVMKYAAWLLGITAGRATDPLGWLVALAVVLFGFSRSRPIWLALFFVPAVALVGTAITVAVVWSWWEQMGVTASWPSRVTYVFVSFTSLAAIVYGFVRVIAALTLPKPDPSSITQFRIRPDFTRFDRPIKRVDLLVFCVGVLIFAFAVSGFIAHDRPFISRIWDGPIVTYQRWGSYYLGGYALLLWIAIPMLLGGAIMAFVYDSTVGRIVAWVNTGK